jgi:hypothetical protein
MLLELATGALGVAVALGAAASVFWLARESRPPPWWLAGAHGGVAIAGYAILVVALPGLSGGAATGTASFDIVAAVLLGAAAAAGLVLLSRHLRKRRVAGALVGLHATLAVSGFVFLAVYALLA